MASTYTTNLGIEKPGTGEQAGTWGATVNTNFDMFDEAISGYVQITLTATGSTGSPNDLPVTDGASSNGRNAYIDVTDGGDLGGNVYVQLTPNDVSRLIWVKNSLSGSQDLYLFQGTYNASRDYVLSAGSTALLHFSGGGAGASTVVKVNTVSGIEGTTILSTGEAGGTKFLREDGDNTSSWQSITEAAISDLGTTVAMVADNLSVFAATTSAQLAGVISDETGSGALVFATSPTLVTPVLGTPASGNLSNCTAYEGTAIASTGEAGGTKFLREDGDGTCSWQTVSAGGGISNVVEDTTPQLGGDLDAQTYDITGSGMLQMDDIKGTGITKYTSDDQGTGAATVDVSANNRFRINNTGALTLTFSNMPSGVDSEVGSQWSQEGFIKIRNGSGTPGTITLDLGAQSYTEIGTQTTTADADQILSYIFQRNGSGTVECTLIWSN